MNANLTKELMHEKLGLSHIRKPEILYLSFFGVGFLPKAPGTWGTLAALPFLYFFETLGAPKFFLIPLLFLMIAASCLVAQYVETRYQIHDPSWIVIDEVLGVSIAWLFVVHQGPLALLAIFALFRFFDIFKWGPVSYFDRMNHGLGTILDDVMAGLLAGSCYALGVGLYSYAFSA